MVELQTTREFITDDIRRAWTKTRSGGGEEHRVPSPSPSIKPMKVRRVRVGGDAVASGSGGNDLGGMPQPFASPKEDGPGMDIGELRWVERTMQEDFRQAVGAVDDMCVRVVVKRDAGVSLTWGATTRHGRSWGP